MNLDNNPRIVSILFTTTKFFLCLFVLFFFFLYKIYKIPLEIGIHFSNLEFISSLISNDMRKIIEC